MTTIISPTNALPHSQRLRLIRSIRKLGDLLTESALLVEPAPPLPSHSRATSMSSPPQSPAHTISEAGSPLLSVPATSPFRRNFFSLRLPNPRSSDSTPTATPLSATFSVFSLNSPTTPVVDVEAVKERKMAKVVQTLGENVPPELVFPSSARKGRKRASTVTVPEYTPEQRAVAAAGATVVGRRRLARDTSRRIKHTASSTSLRAKAPVMDIDPFEPFSYASLVLVPTTEHSPSPEPPVEPTPRSSGAKGTMHRKELGWSGEWSGSVQNMDDVVRGLRGLRFK
ncbi:hypothetical protein DFH09DRAFT_1178269 [Mycena vulgaris]|nr:hypothetical protein DFH09DRAFT_1178269 [Mycena vulgaris]